MEKYVRIWRFTIEKETLYTSKFRFYFTSFLIYRKEVILFLIQHEEISGKSLLIIPILKTRSR